MTLPKLIATCWTSAGAVAPLDSSEVSPIPPLERIQAIADAGWDGFGLGQDDLRKIEETVGFQAVYEKAQELNLRHIEVEFGTGWWQPESTGWRDTWNLLLRAGQAMKTEFIKIGTTFGEPIDNFALMVEPMRAIANEAQDLGTKIALEPLPFSLIASMPQGAELINEVNHPAAGLVVDYWHVFRAATSLAELAASVPVEKIFGVELSDANHAIVGTLFEDTRDNRKLLTEGEQDVVGFIRTLQKMGYQGAYGVEILSIEHRARNPLQGMILARESGIKAFELAQA